MSKWSTIIEYKKLSYLIKKGLRLSFLGLLLETISISKSCLFQF